MNAESAQTGIMSSASFKLAHHTISVMFSHGEEWKSISQNETVQK